MYLSMAYTLGNKCAKNLVCVCKRTVLLQLIIINVVTCFLGTQCSFIGIKHLHAIPTGSPLRER